MSKFIKKYYFSVLFVVSLITLIVLSYFSLHRDYKKGVKQFQYGFNKVQNELDSYMERISSLEDLTKIARHKSYPFDTYLYINDSLSFWSSNDLPISRFANDQFPAEGIIHLQNGWYYAKVYERDSFKVATSFLIRNNFNYENKYLKNSFNSRFGFPYKAYISLEKAHSYPIYDNGKFIFGLIPYATQGIKFYYSDGIFALLVLTTFFFFRTLVFFLRRKSLFTKIFIASLLVWLRYLSLTGNWFSIYHDITAFQSTLYATSPIFPTFADLWLNLLLAIFLLRLLGQILLPSDEENEHVKFAYARSIATVLVLFAFVIFNHFIFKGIIENSSIKLDVSKLFSLNFYSFMALTSVGLLFYEALQIFRRINEFNFEQEFSPLFKVLTTFLLIFLYFVFNVWIHLPLSEYGLMILIFVCFHYFGAKYQKELPNYTVIIILFLFSVHSFNTLQSSLNKKEQQERQLLANQLASDQDISTELEYNTIREQLETDDYLKKLLVSNKKISPSGLKENLEKRWFHGFWEQYEMDFFLFNKQRNSILNFTDNNLSSIRQLDNIITFNSVASDVDDNVFYIKNFTSQYAYIIKQFIRDENHFYGYLYIALKSKKIPENIGYPRLLISSKSKVFDVLENYSIAKYYNHKLVYDYGNYVYPSVDDKIVRRLGKNEEGFINRRGYSHFVYKRTDMDTIVVSKPERTTFQFFTSFSYLFCFFGLLLLLPLFERVLFKKKWRLLPTLALRIQILLIGIVLITLFAYGIGSGIFIQRQYNEITDEHIRDKLTSISVDLKNLSAGDSTLFDTSYSDLLEVRLKNLSNVFSTDINIFTPNGYLLSTSRQKLYNSGLISEQMNPDAMRHISRFNNSEYIHEESIGNLSYTSGYVPIYNEYGEIKAIINLQQFGQQEQYQLQIEHYLVSILNIFILLLAFTTMFTLFISNWITLPLKKLQDSIANIRLGKYNQPIEYQGKDEIGALVDKYNEKLQELEYTAQQLAQSERENAWKEMAKQVAHEIKNPLTPMKLRLQHFKRLFDEGKIEKDKVENTINSIIKQIDTLAGIANEFSNFAKMPRNQFVPVDLVEIIDNVIDLYQVAVETEIEFFHAKRECWVSGDKDLLLRIFNNMIQNALQAIPENRLPKVKVFIHKIKENWQIEIHDNGIGISKPNQERIFTPYFTTKTKGTGLGLAMVKQIVDMHNGKIDYKTSPEGTTFTIIFHVLENENQEIDETEV